MTWILESWATRRDDEDKAVKITVRLTQQPGPMELADFRAKATGLFRTVYSEWADSLGEHVTEQ